MMLCFRPVSAYALFFRDTQAAIKCQNPSASFGEMSKIVAAMWDTLDDLHKNVSIVYTSSLQYPLLFPNGPHFAILLFHLSCRYANRQSDGSLRSRRRCCSYDNIKLWRTLPVEISARYKLDYY